MTENELLLAYRRFLACYSPTLYFVSDNAPQFKLLSEIISINFKHEFTWKFLPAFSPWQGGVYERMVALVKDSLLRTYHHTTLSHSAVRTSLVEIAGVLNSRPLTYVSEDGADTPLRPADYLKASFHLPEELSPPTQSTPTASQAVSLWKQSKETSDRFWSIWQTEYLQHLRTNQRFYDFPKNVSTVEPQTGMVVLIAKPRVKRHSWCLGRILRLNTSDDGQIRSADIAVGTRTPGLKLTKCPIITRPLFHLYPLELPQENSLPPIDPVHQDDEEVVIEVETGIDF